MNIIYYNKLNSENDKLSLEDNYDKIIHKNHILVRKESDKNTYFHTDINKLESLILNNPNVCYHECLGLDKKVKIFMDIDDSITKDEKKHNSNIDIIRREFCSFFNSKFTCLANVSKLEDKDFITIKSHKKDGSKYSTNLVVKGYYFINLNSLNIFMMRFKKKLEINNKSLLNYIDFGIYKKNHTIRLPNSSKLGENRPKVSDHKFYESLITNINENEDILLSPNVSEESLEDNIYYHNDVKFNEHNLLLMRISELDNIQNIIPSIFTFGDVKNNVIFLIRRQSSYCNFCDRIHEKDNTNYLVVTNSGDVYLKCTRPKEEGRVSGSTLMGKIDMESIIEQEYYINDDEYNIDYDNNENPGLNDLSADDYNNIREYDINDFRRILAQEKNYKMKYLLKDIYFNNPNPGPNFKGYLPEENLEYYESEYIKDFVPVEGGVNLEKAEMKMGKTKKCKDFIYESEYSNSLNTILFISFRRTFSEEIKSKFKDFESYKDIKSPNINLNDHPRLIIQTESLHRLNENSIENVDLIILDEIESIWSQFGSGNFSNINSSLSNFERLLKKSKYIFGFDANIGIRTIELFKKIIPNKPINLRINTYKISKDDVYYICPNMVSILSKLRDDLDDNKRIAIFTNSCNDAMAMKLFIKNLYLEKNVKVYTGKTDEKIKNQHFSDVDTHWVNYDIIICSPTVTAGVSFEKEHFDVVYGIFTNHSCNVNICRQMLGRIRNVGQKEYYIYISDFKQSFPTDINIIENYLLYDRSYFIRLINNDAGVKSLQINLDTNGNVTEYNKNILYWIIISNIREDNYSKNNFTKVFLDALAYSGVTKLIYINNSDRELFKEYSDYKSISKLNENLKIANAKDIDDNMAQLIRQKIDAQIIVLKDEYNSYRKYNLKKRYNWDKLIDVNFVNTYEDSKIQCQYTNLQEILNNNSQTNEACIDRLIKDYNNYKNNINQDVVTYREVLNKYKSFNHYIINELLSAFNKNFNIHDAFMNGGVSYNDCKTNFQKYESVKKIDWKFIVNKFNMSIYKYPDNFDDKLKIIQNIINNFYGFKLYKDKKTNTILLKHNNNFNYIDQNNNNLLDCEVDEKKPTINVIF